jgi:cholecystokinin-like receptor
MERYFAICRPLTSLRWQTRRHAYKTIGLVWTVAVVIMIPAAVKQKLLRMPTGGHKCAEMWEDRYREKV